MSILKISVRWLALLSGMAFFLIYLNSAAYRAWLAGGPPTPNPEGWLFSAWNFLSWSFAFLFGGIGVFIVIGRFPPVSKVAVIFLVLSAILGVVPFAREFLAQDACLDSGGKWSTQELKCINE